MSSAASRVWIRYFVGNEIATYWAVLVFIGTCRAKVAAGTTFCAFISFPDNVCLLTWVPASLSQIFHFPIAQAAFVRQRTVRRQVLFLVSRQVAVQCFPYITYHVFGPVHTVLPFAKEQFIVEEVKLEAVDTVRLCEEFHGARTCMIAAAAFLLDVEHTPACSSPRFLEGVVVLGPYAVHKIALEVVIGRVSVVDEVHFTLRVVSRAVQLGVLLAIPVEQTLHVWYWRKDAVVLHSCLDSLIH